MDKPRSRRFASSIATFAALVALGACGVPVLQRVPGSDLVARTRAHPRVTTSSRSCGVGQKGRGVGVSGPNVTVGEPTGFCTRATIDTVPESSRDLGQPPRPVP